MSKLYTYILKLKPAQSHNISGLFHGMDPSPKVHGFYHPTHNIGDTNDPCLL